MAGHSVVRSLLFYESEPFRAEKYQPRFINRVAALETALPPEQLLDALQEMERQQGRVRLKRWGPRIIDLDILLYGDDIIHTERLTVPHIGIKERAFVLYPLTEIAPDLILPTGESVAQLKAQCKTRLLKLKNFYQRKFYDKKNRNLFPAVLIRLPTVTLI